MSKRAEWFPYMFSMFLTKFTTWLWRLWLPWQKPLIDFTSLELYEENQESVVGQARVINQHVSHKTIERTLPGSLQELPQRSTEHLRDNWHIGLNS